MEKKNGSIRQVLKFTLFSASAGLIQIAAFAILEIFIKDYWIPYGKETDIEIAKGRSEWNALFGL